MRISWTVELPEEHKYNGQACEDPAIEAALEAIPQATRIFLWGEREEPAQVFLEVHEEDVEIEEDDR